MHSTCNSISLDYDTMALEYKEVFEYLFKTSDRFSMVTVLMKPYSKRPPNCKHDNVLLRLNKYLVSQEIGVREWPGTRTRENHRVLNTYCSCSQSRDSLLELPNAFYATKFNSPEDICFYRESIAWFATVTHEKMAFILCPTKEDQRFFEKYRR